MSGKATVQIRFATTLDVAMVMDWPQALGLVDPKLMRRLEIGELEVEVVNGETRIGPYESPPEDPFTAPVIVAVRRLICFFPKRKWRMAADGPWLSIDFEPAWGEEATPENDKRSFAVWLRTGEVWRIGQDGAVDDDAGPVDFEALDPERDRL